MNYKFINIKLENKLKFGNCVVNWSKVGELTFRDRSDRNIIRKIIIKECSEKEYKKYKKIYNRLDYYVGEEKYWWDEIWEIWNKRD